MAHSKNIYQELTERICPIPLSGQHTDSISATSRKLKQPGFLSIWGWDNESLLAHYQQHIVETKASCRSKSWNTHNLTHTAQGRVGGQETMDRMVVRKRPAQEWKKTGKKGKEKKHRKVPIQSAVYKQTWTIINMQSVWEDCGVEIRSLLIFSFLGSEQKWTKHPWFQFNCPVR